MSPPPTQRGGAPAQCPASENASRRQAAGHSHEHDTALDNPELRAEVGRLTEPVITAVRRQHGRIFGVATKEWWRADDPAKLAGVMVLALAWCVCDPERMVRERLKAMAVDLSTLHDWRAASRRPAHSTLAARRGEPGPMWQSFDPQAAARWVATGSGEGATA